MAARSDAQTLVALRFVDCPTASQRLEQKLSKDATQGVEFAPEATETLPKPDDFESLDFRVKIDDLDLPARLVNLPTIVETHKTWDRETYVKCGDVGQILLVFKDEMARTADKARQAAHEGGAWAAVHPDGLTPPLQNVVKRRFAKARKRSRKDVSVDEVRKAEDLLVQLRNNDNEVPEETVSEDVVRFEDWMIDEQGKGREFREDGLRDSDRAWMFLSSSELQALGARGTPVLMPRTSTTPRNQVAPDLSSLAKVTAYRARVADTLVRVNKEMEALKRAGSPAPGGGETAARDLATKGAQRKRLGVQMARLDQKMLEFAASAGGAQMDVEAAPLAAPGTGKRLSLKLPTRLAVQPAGAAPAAAPGQGKRLNIKLPTRPADPTAAPTAPRLSFKLPARPPTAPAPPTGAPMEVEPAPAAPGQGKRLSFKLPSGLAVQPPAAPPPPPAPVTGAPAPAPDFHAQLTAAIDSVPQPPPSSNAISDE